MSAIQKAIDIAARMVNRKPTDGQKEAGNYAKGHVKIHGLDVAIENPKGGSRSGVDRGGKAWSVRMPAHYGYVKGTEGKDGDHVDVYIGPEPEAPAVFVVDQVDAETGRFDEHKVMLGFRDQMSALAAYKKAFSDGRGGERISGVTKMSIPAFKAWLRSGKTKKPLSAESGKYVENVGDGAMRRYANGGAVTFRDQSVTVSPIEEALRGYADGGEIMPWERPSPGEYDIRRGEAAPPNSPEVLREAPDDAFPSTLDLLLRYGSAPAKAVAGAAGKTVQDVADAIDDPSISNLASAGTGIATFAAPFNPMTAAKILGLGYAGAAAKDLGLLPFGSAQAQSVEQKLRAMTPSELVAYQRLIGTTADGTIGRDTISKATAYEERQKAIADAQSSAEAKVKMLEQQGANAAKIEAARIEAQGAADRERLRLQEEEKRKGAADADKRAAFKRQVGVADAAKAEELGKANLFSDSEVGKLWNKTGVLTPALAAFGMGAMTRAGAAALGKSGALWDYGVPALEGLGLGVAMPHYPLAHDAFFTPVENPERKAFMAYARELPPDHPRKQEMQEYARSLPEGNPTRERASTELYDPKKALERSIFGGIEGLTMAPAGSMASRIVAHAPGQAISFAAKAPGRALEDFYSSMEKANAARGKAQSAAAKAEGKVALNRQRSAQALEDARGAESDAVRKALDVAEAQGRKALPPGGQGTPPPKGSQSGSGSGRQGGSGKTPGQSPRGGSGQSQTSKQPSLPEPKGSGSADAPGAQGGVLPNGTPIPKGKPTSASTADDAVPTADPHGKYVDYDPTGRHGRIAHQLFSDIEQGKFVVPPNLGPDEARALLTSELIQRLNRAGTPVNPAPIPSMVDKTVDALAETLGPGSAAKTVDEAIALARQRPGTLMYIPGAVGGASLLPGEGEDPAPEVERKDGGAVPEVAAEPKVYLKTKNKTGKWQMRETNGKYAAGGAIGRAVSTARSYATGGAVHVGPVVGATGGRADKLPVAVPEGAFVVPADIVSGLGEGNTLAGMEMLTKTFGKPGAAGGSSPVPIKISDGEFVISPEQVAKIGQGDVSRGHQVLDQMIHKLRRQHIKTLAELPPPAK